VERTAEEAIRSVKAHPTVEPSRDPKLPFGVDPNSIFLNHTARFQKFIASLDSDPTPSLSFLHVLLPHAPWHFLPSGTQYPEKDPAIGLLEDRWTAASPWPAAVARQRHLLQLRYLDGLIGQLIDRMKETRLWDRAVLVVTADHGVSFTPGEPKRSATARNYFEMAWLPLFIHAPHQTTGVISDQNIQSIDVLPTVADLAHVKIPWKVEGISAVTGRRDDGERRIFYTAPDQIMRLDASAGARLVREDAAGDFAPRRGPLRLYQIGRFGSLVGTTIGPARPRSGAAVVFEHPERFRTVDPSTGSVPAFVIGTLRGEDLRGRWVAITVNGVVGAVSEVFSIDDVQHIAGMIPEQLFKVGANDVRAYLVDGSTFASLTS
jgi:hypothetical protein